MFGWSEFQRIQNSTSGKRRRDTGMSSSVHRSVPRTIGLKRGARAGRHGLSTGRGPGTKTSHRGSGTNRRDRPESSRPQAAPRDPPWRRMAKADRHSSGLGHPNPHQRSRRNVAAVPQCRGGWKIPSTSGSGRGRSEGARKAERFPALNSRRRPGRCPELNWFERTRGGNGGRCFGTLGARALPERSATWGSRVSSGGRDRTPAGSSRRDPSYAEGCRNGPMPTLTAKHRSRWPGTRGCGLPERRGATEKDGAFRSRRALRSLSSPGRALQATAAIERTKGAFAVMEGGKADPAVSTASLPARLPSLKPNVQRQPGSRGQPLAAGGLP